jgi:hypothetical protein
MSNPNTNPIHECCFTCRWYLHSNPLTRKDCPKCTGEGNRIDKHQYHEPTWAIVKEQWKKANESNNEKN